MSTKICSCCKKELSLDAFVKDKYSASGYKSWCKPCGNEKSRKYYSSLSLELKRDRMRLWRDKNRQYFNDYLKSRNGLNPNFEPRGRSEGISREEARAKIKNWKSQHDKENKEKLKEYRKEYYSKEDKIEMRRSRTKKWLNSNPSAKMAQVLRHRLRTALKDQDTEKRESISELLGCSFDDFIKYIESKWESGMSWDNYGAWVHGEPPKWNLDHVRPCASYNLEILSEQRNCFNYKNIRPIWGNENYQKRDTIIGCPWGYDFQI
jgi:hypothetical protein